MKYIRTNILGEEDIYFINDTFLVIDRVYLSNKKSNIAIDTCSKKDLESLGKTADTIEELCDELVLTDDKGKKHYSSVEGNIFIVGAIAYRDSVRGAIWTDKGLIYVAKMNDKGELELI